MIWVLFALALMIAASTALVVWLAMPPIPRRTSSKKRRAAR